MINSTKHSFERWVERILDIKTIKERDEYIRDNRDQLNEHMNKSFEFADFIYKGQIGDNVTRNYYIKNDIIFVLNTTNDAFITVYKVDFNFTTELNLSVAKGLLEEVCKLLKEKEEIDLKALEETEFKKSQSEQLDSQIKLMQEQINLLKQDKKFIDESIKQVENKSKVVELEIKKYTGMLVNSKEYREDLKTM